jgi:hypothetical protein
MLAAEHSFAAAGFGFDRSETCHPYSSVVERKDGEYEDIGRQVAGLTCSGGLLRNRDHQQSRLPSIAVSLSF